MNEPNIFLTGCYCFLGLMAALIFIFWRIYKFGKWQEKHEDDYNSHYQSCKGMIDEKMNPENYDYIQQNLKLLGKMRHKDRERTSKLSADFYWKYRKECLRRTLEEIEK